MKLYDYDLSESWAAVAGRSSSDRSEMGIIAQDLQQVLPDAVRSTGKQDLGNGEFIDDLLVVNKDRVFMENVGAVQELCRMTENLEFRINELETLNRDIRRRAHSASSCTSSSSKLSARSRRYTRRHNGCCDSEDQQQAGLVSQRPPFPLLQLVCSLTLCLLIASVLAVGVALLITQVGEHDGSSSGSSSDVIATSSLASNFQSVLTSNMATSTSDLEAKPGNLFSSSIITTSTALLTTVSTLSTSTIITSSAVTQPSNPIYLPTVTCYDKSVVPYFVGCPAQISFEFNSPLPDMDDDVLTKIDQVTDAFATIMCISANRVVNLHLGTKTTFDILPTRTFGSVRTSCFLLLFF